MLQRRPCTILEEKVEEALKALTDANKTIIILPVPIFFTHVHKDIPVLIDGLSNCTRRQQQCELFQIQVKAFIKILAKQI